MLFPEASDSDSKSVAAAVLDAPLAERLRPQASEQFIGQPHL